MWFRKKTKPGHVYGAESTRQNGDKEVYTGITRRSLRTRWGEYMRGRGGKYTGIWSRNPIKAEKTIKRMNSNKKRFFWRVASSRYKNRKNGF